MACARTAAPSGSCARQRRTLEPGSRRTGEGGQGPRPLGPVCCDSWPRSQRGDTGHPSGFPRPRGGGRRRRRERENRIEEEKVMEEEEEKVMEEEEEEEEGDGDGGGGGGRW